MLLIPQALFCQREFKGIDKKQINLEPNLAGELLTQYKQPDIVTFFNRDWLPGNIVLTDGRIIRNTMIKYNGLLDELFWLEPNSYKSIKIDKEEIHQFHFLNFQGDTTVYFRKIKVKRDNYYDSIEIFVQEMNRGPISLYIFHFFFIVRKEEVFINESKILKEIYSEAPVYYLRFLNNSFVELKRFSRKNVYALFPDKRNQIRQYLNNSISGRAKTQSEIISFVQFLNTIIDH
jgi:hypothetical protein